MGGGRRRPRLMPGEPLETTPWGEHTPRGVRRVEVPAVAVFGIWGWEMAEYIARRQVMETTLDRFGRIVIPKRVRDDLGLRAGSVLEIDDSDDRIVLRVRREEPDLVQEDGVLVYTGEPVGDIEEAVENQRRRRSRDVAAWRHG